jgi:limonene-1,2-epoxide hydrolase
MPTPIETIQRFCTAWEAPHSWKQALRDYFTADCRYENVGMSLTHGPAEAAAFFEGFAAQTGFASLGIDVLAISAHGNTVLTERVDHLRRADGSLIISLRLMGVFEVTPEGRISAWRDYFDTAAFGGK